jgi:mRNA-degrading endonuclease RelE of RelBE toxin-antitoxin system
MSYRVDTTPNFEREAKRLIKKYKSLQNEINSLNDSLEEKPKQGAHLGNDIYKIRLAVKSQEKGKRGGAKGYDQSKNCRPDGLHVFHL